jgi:hypothetical protein
VSAPKLEHWELAKRVPRYLRGTVSFGLCYGANDKLCGYTDSDFAGDGATAKSTTGCVFELGGAAISWASKRQTVVATSTCEAEYIAAAFGAKEGSWLRSMLRELKCADMLGGATSIGIDNNGALCLLQNGGTHARTKHIKVAYHFARECHASGELEFVSCNTEDQHADFLTRPLAADVFERQIAWVGVGKVM